jgi:DNA-binding beta-propeller fold protein YncE
MKNANSNNPTVSSIIRNWIGGGSFYFPSFAFVDIENSDDLYVSEYGNCRVVLFSSMQINNPPPRVVAGINKTIGPYLNEMNGPRGIAVDKQKNLYIADSNNHRIMRWAPNATAGVIIAGTNTSGSDSMSLDGPNGIFLDQNNSLLYVADFVNCRIQVFHLNGTPPYNGTTVAGGNGPGSGNHQLNGPSDVWVSAKTGTIYIADMLNNRIQKWSKGATSGVTLAGSPYGNAGSDSTMLNSPTGLSINANETRMYVSDSYNGRVQRFDLI